MRSVNGECRGTFFLLLVPLWALLIIFFLKLLSIKPMTINMAYTLPNNFYLHFLSFFLWSTRGRWELYWRLKQPTWQTTGNSEQEPWPVWLLSKCLFKRQCNRQLQAVLWLIEVKVTFSSKFCPLIIKITHWQCPDRFRLKNIINYISFASFA